MSHSKPHALKCSDKVRTSCHKMTPVCISLHMPNVSSWRLAGRIGQICLILNRIQAWFYANENQQDCHSFVSEQCYAFPFPSLCYSSVRLPLGHGYFISVTFFHSNHMRYLQQGLTKVISLPPLFVKSGSA